MATTGTVDQTLVTVAEIIDLAFRRCGKVPSTVSGELLTDARLSLTLLLTNMVNRGISLWCLKKTVISTVPLKGVYAIAQGTQDINNALLRQLYAMVGTANSGAGYQGVVLTAAQSIRNVSGTFAADAVTNLVIEYSVDNTTWSQAAALSSITVTAGSTFAVDLDNTFLAQYWRVRDTSGTLVALTSLLFRTFQSELPMSQLNRDDYQNLPQKFTPGQLPLQYWFDKQLNPQMWVWPVPSIGGQQLVVWGQQLIQDVGSLSNNLAVPTRWLDSIVFTLAARLALIIPPSELPPGRLEYLDGKSSMAVLEAENGESDGSPMRLAPRIGGYTK